MSITLPKWSCHWRSPELEVYITRLSKGSFVVRIAIHKYNDFPALIHIQLQLEQTNNICFFLAIFFYVLASEPEELVTIFLDICYEKNSE